MKILISENQLRDIILSEQSDYSMDQRANATLKTMGVRSDADYKTVNQINTKATQGTSTEQAAVKLMMEIGASLLPVVGNFIGALIGGYYAQDEFNKGNKKTGGLIAILSLLPLIPQIKSAIPSLSKLGQNGIKNLSDKLTGVVKTPLTPTEVNVVKELAYKIEPIKQNLTRINDAVKNTVDYKGKYIKTYGKIKFQNLFNKLIKGEINKQQYIDELVGGLKNSYEKIKFSTIAGVKFTENELNQLTDLSKKILNSEINLYYIKLIIGGVEKDIPVRIASYTTNGNPVIWDAVALRNKGEILVNYQKVKSMNLEKLLNTLSHECAHLKDASFVSSKMTDEYGKTVSLIEKYKTSYENATKQFGAESKEALDAWKKYSENFTKYEYHYREMIANNSKVLQSLSRNARGLIGQFGVPETQKMISFMKDGLKRGIPQNIDYYLGKLIGKDNASYVRQIRTFDKNLYKDLLKKLSKQIQYMEEQLKLYQQ